MSGTIQPFRSASLTPYKPEVRFAARYKVPNAGLTPRQMAVAGTGTLAGGFALKGVALLMLKLHHPAIGAMIYVGGMLVKATGATMLIKSGLAKMKGKPNAEKPKSFWGRIGYYSKKGVGSTVNFFNRSTQRLQDGISSGVDYTLGSVFNFFWARKNRKAIEKVHADLMAIDRNSADYFKPLRPVLEFLVKGVEVEINTEDGRIQDLARSNESCVFLVNNNRSPLDTALLSIFTMLLYDEAIRQGKGAVCPRPKFIVGSNFVKTHRKKVQDILEYSGVVGINTRHFPRTKQINENLTKMSAVVDGLIQNKNHLFFFPNVDPKQVDKVPMEERFMTALSKVMLTSAERKPYVKVVPIGFAHNNSLKKPLGSIRIEKPLYFKLVDEKQLSVTEGPPDDVNTPWTAFPEQGVKAITPALSNWIYKEMTDIHTEANAQLPKTAEADPQKWQNPLEIKSLDPPPPPPEK